MEKTRTSQPKTKSKINRKIIRKINVAISQSTPCRPQAVRNTLFLLHFHWLSLCGAALFSKVPWHLSLVILAKQLLCLSRRNLFQRSCFIASSPCREKPSLVKSRRRRILYLRPIFWESFVDLTPGPIEKTSWEILDTMSSLVKHQQALGLRCLLASTMCWKL